MRRPYHDLLVYVFIQHLDHEQDATQRKFLSGAQSDLLFTHSWKENGLICSSSKTVKIHTIPKVWHKQPRPETELWSLRPFPKTITVTFIMLSLVWHKTGSIELSVRMVFTHKGLLAFIVNNNIISLA